MQKEKRAKPKMKIVMVGLLCNSNIGDRLLFDCSEFLLKQCLGSEDITFEKLDFHARKTVENESSRRGTDTDGLRNKINRLLGHQTNNYLLNFLKFHIWKKSRGKAVIKYYNEHLANCDLLFFIGGGTLSYHLDYDWSRYYFILTQLAAKKRIPVIMNGIGVESRYVFWDYRARLYRKALNSLMVKAISTRNNKPDMLQGYMLESSLECCCVADAAVWAAETFSVKKAISKIYGIGVIAAKRFDECKREISSENYEEYLVNLVELLNRNNREWEFFTNGAHIDNDYLEYLCEKYNISKSRIRMPSTGKELTEVIAKYSVIITSRLHSCITACSLDIPFVAVVWNDKLKMFAEALKCSERAVDIELNAEKVFDLAVRAEQDGYDEYVRETFRNTDVKFLKEAIANIF